MATIPEGYTPVRMALDNSTYRFLAVGAVYDRLTRVDTGILEKVGGGGGQHEEVGGYPHKAGTHFIAMVSQSLC